MVMMILALLCATTFVPQGDVLVNTVQATAHVFESIEEKELIQEMKRVMLEELNEKYGNGNFEIVNVSEQQTEYMPMLEFEIKTSYLNNNFKVSMTKSGGWREDNFVDVYAKEKWGATNLEEFAIQKAMERNNSLYSSYDIKIKNDYQNFTGFEDYFEGRVPTIDDCISRVDLGRKPTILVGETYTKNDLDRFTNNIIAAYKIYAIQYASDYYFNGTMSFEFENGINPFCDPDKDKLGAYADGGYIRDAGSLYLIYLNPTPLKIDK